MLPKEKIKGKIKSGFWHPPSFLRAKKGKKNRLKAEN